MQIPNEHTTSPIVTGTSVLGIRFAGGVLLMSDTLGSYGSMARFPDLTRFYKANEETVLGIGGEYSDLQFLQRSLKELELEDTMAADSCTRSPSEVHSYVTRVMYHRRTKINPLYNQIAVAGFNSGEAYLGYVDLYGSSYRDNVVTTGFGQYLAAPILRKAYRPDLTEAEARGILEQCMRVLFYRDGRTINRFQLARCDSNGVYISDPYSLSTEWEFARFVNPQLTALA